MPRTVRSSRSAATATSGPPASVSGMRGRESRALEQPLDRQQRQEADPETSKKSGLRLRGTHARIPLAALDPFEAAAVGRETQLVRVIRDRMVECFGEPPREPRAIDHHAHLGVESCRARIKIERTDEDAGAV